MSNQRIAVLGLTGLLALGAVPPVDADARPKGLHKGDHGPFVKLLQRNLNRAGFSKPDTGDPNGHRPPGAWGESPWGTA